MSIKRYSFTAQFIFDADENLFKNVQILTEKMSNTALDANRENGYAMVAVAHCGDIQILDIPVIVKVE